jgi:hypothetical protein
MESIIGGEMGKRAEKRKRRIERAKVKARVLCETMKRMSPGCIVTWTIDNKKQKPRIRVKKRSLV